MKEFDEAAALLPPALRREAQALPPLVRRRVEEIRLRSGRPPTAVIGEDEFPLSQSPVEGRDLELTLEIATRASAHTALESVRRGYYTVKGGHRVGLCGSVWTEDGQVKNLRRLSSLNIRVAHAVPGCGEKVLPELLCKGKFLNTLLLSPPGGGKTTLLRDLVRLLSDGVQGTAFRVGLCDERGEVAALWEGRPQFDVGGRTDVLEGCPKAQGLTILLRGMNPQILCCDEVTAPEDCAALEQCGNCGVKLLATVHAEGVEDLLRKPLYRELLARGGFAIAVSLRRWTTPRYVVEDLPPCGG